jgi:hypothetical protein
MIGDEYQYRYKVIKQGIIMGLGRSHLSKFPNFWAVFDNKMQFSVELEQKEQALQASFTITLQDGLTVKFLPNGDVMQIV